VPNIRYRPNIRQHFLAEYSFSAETRKSVFGRSLNIGEFLPGRQLEEKARAKAEAEGGDVKKEEKDEWIGKNTKGLVRSKATLVVCPASLLGQWEGEAKKRLKTDTLRDGIHQC
jgi:hypothetical protein